MAIFERIHEQISGLDLVNISHQLLSNRRTNYPKISGGWIRIRRCIRQ